MRLLTGSPTRIIWSAAQSREHEVRESLAAAMREWRIAVATTPGRAQRVPPPGISGNHAYAILDFDEDRTVVVSQNPHVAVILPDVHQVRRSALQHSHGRLEMKRRRRS